MTVTFRGASFPKVLGVLSNPPEVFPLAALAASASFPKCSGVFKHGQYSACVVAICVKISTVLLLGRRRVPSGGVAKPSIALSVAAAAFAVAVRPYLRLKKKRVSIEFSSVMYGQTGHLQCI